MKTDLQQVLSKAIVLKERLNSKQALFSQNIQGRDMMIGHSLSQPLHVFQCPLPAEILRLSISLSIV